MKIGLLPLLCFAALACHAAATPADAVLVLEKEQNTLVIVDPASLTIVARIPAGENPHEVAVSGDGKTAYISNYSGHTISRVDLVAQKALPPINLGAMTQPHGLDFVGGRLYFTAEGARVVGRYDPATGKIDWILGTGQDRTHMVIATKDLTTVLTSNVASATISIIQKSAQGRRRPVGSPPGRGPGRPGGPPPSGFPPSDWEIANIPVGQGSEGFDLTPNGKELWVANAQDKTISIIDIAARKVMQTLPSTGDANRLKITLDGKYAMASDQTGEGVLVIDVATRKPYKTIKIGTSTEGLLMAPDGLHAYTTLNQKDSVAVIDLKTFTVTGEVKTGRGPDGLAWASRK